MIFILLNIFGICLAIVGLFLIYKYGISPRFKKGPRTYIYTKEEVVNKEKRLKNKETDHKKMADIGLWLSIAGMFLQAINQLLLLFI